MADTYSNTLPDSTQNPARLRQPAHRILERLLSGHDGSVAIRLWNGTQYVVGNEPSAFTLVVHDPTLLDAGVLSVGPKAADAIAVG